MRALAPEVIDVVWESVQDLIPVPVDTHPLGCHRRRVPDRICLTGILYRLVTGASWQTVEHLLGGQVSDTTLRARRNEWVNAGVFTRLFDQALAAYDRIIGLDLTEVSIDGSNHTAACGGAGTGSNPANRGKTGWKWSIATDKTGIPVGWSIDAANRHDSKLLLPTLSAIARQGLLPDIETIHLDRGYDYRFVRELLIGAGIEPAIVKRKPRGQARPPAPYQTPHRWVVERTNSWLNNFGQLRRNTDRNPTHRNAQLALATTILIITKLIAWRDRHHPPLPIR